jgi:hypothetical protein
MTPLPTPSRSTGLGALICLILLAAALADVGSRAIPAKFLAFRAWEAADLLPWREGGFTPNFVYQNPASYGDLASLYNLPGMREYRPERFTTDAQGFRNPAGGPSAPNVVLFGDSFGAGAGLSDQDILSEQILRQGGGAIRIFNAAHFSNNIDRMLALLDRLGFKNGVIVFQISETFRVPEWPQSPDPVTQAQGLLRRFLPAGMAEQGAYYLRCVRNLTRYSPMEILCRRVYRTAQNDVFLPNAPAANGSKLQLSDGTSMLFLTATLGQNSNPAAADTRYLEELDSALRTRGNKLLVLLVPDKSTVYAPFLKEPAAGPDYMDRVEAQLHAKRIPVVNLLQTFRVAAGTSLRNHELIYFRDDTHWNRQGIDLASRAVVVAMPGP